LKRCCRSTAAMTSAAAGAQGLQLARRQAAGVPAHTNVEWFAFGAGLGHDPAKTGEPQTHRNYSWRDYGNRIGVWRLLELFDELKLPRAQYQQPALRLRAADHGGDPQARR